MPKLTLTVSHQLGADVATERVKQLLEKVRSQYAGQLSDLEESWDERLGTFGFTTYGFHIKGTVAIEPTEVRIDGELPFAAVMFKGRIEQTIRDEMSKLLA